MSNHENSHEAPRAPGNEGGNSGRKPYRKPAFRHERVFETSALTCGKMSDTQFACKHCHKTS
jgi:hypothetical protein